MRFAAFIFLVALMLTARLIGETHGDEVRTAMGREMVEEAVWEPPEASAEPAEVLPPRSLPVLPPMQTIAPSLVEFTTRTIDVEWAIGLVRYLGITPTAWNIAFLDEWARHEGAYAASYNPLATTMWAEGSWCFNEVCVRHYPDQLTGILATAQTLQLSYYPAIRETLSTSTMIPGTARELRTWGTMLLADKIERGWTP